MEKHRPVIFARPGPFPWFVDAESDASPALGYLSSRSEQAEAVRCSARLGVALIRQWHWTLAAIAGRDFADLPSPELRRLSASVREPSFSIHRLRACSHARRKFRCVVFQRLPQASHTGSSPRAPAAASGAGFWGRAAPIEPICADALIFRVRYWQLEGFDFEECGCKRTGSHQVRARGAEACPTLPPTCGV